MGGRGYGGVGRVYTYHYTVTTRMIPALRWAAMRAILMFQQGVMDKVTRQCPQTTTFSKRKESRSGIEPRSFRLPAYRLTARPNWLSKADVCSVDLLYKDVDVHTGVNCVVDNKAEYIQSKQHCLPVVCAFSSN